MSNTERHIILTAVENPDWTHSRIAKLMHCSRTHVTKTLGALRQGRFGKAIPVPSLSDIELCIRVPSDVNNGLQKIRRLAA